MNDNDKEKQRNATDVTTEACSYCSGQRAAPAGWCEKREKERTSSSICVSNDAVDDGESDDDEDAVGGWRVMIDPEPAAVGLGGVGS